ncbi:MAG: hypothetical protein GY832_39895 [Chloroflexi bacterium]|nr:hypothetical protein [Chloroflexota bacterium]
MPIFRRRPGRRPPLGRRRAPLPGRGRFPLPPKVRRALTRANRLMANGQFAEAVTIFDRLSEKAKRRDMLVRAANLTLQASRAHFAANNVDVAIDRARDALQLLVRGDRLDRVPRLLSKMTFALREKGYDAQADRLEHDAARMLEEAGSSLQEARERTPQVTERHGTLPPQCRGCGASLVPDEVEWHDMHTAECVYCGTVVKAA